MRSRLWTLILRELPFPFREIGTEVLRLLTWVDRTAVRLWLNLVRTPAWFAVSVSGMLAVGLTCLLFFSVVARHDPTVAELIQKARAIPMTRETLEKTGDWTAQDKWRLAHLFVDHRPPRRPLVRQLDSRLVDDFPAFAAVPGHRGLERRLAYSPRFRADELVVPTAVEVPDPEVRLDLARPAAAEEPRRLVDGRLIRETAEPNGTLGRRGYRTRDSRLLVQAEWTLGPDCDSGDLVQRPKRRIIPVPEPEWNEPEPLTDSRRPDLSLEMSLIREFLPSMSEFPPRSRFNEVSAQSELPEIVVPRRNEFDPDVSPWDITQSRPDERVDAYTDRVGPDDEGPLTDDFNPQIASAPSFTEIALRLQLQGPATTTSGRLNRSALVLRNVGVDEIPLLMVREPLANLETVTDAIPAARVDQFENALERRLRNLEPGKDQQLELEWRAESAGRRTHSALVTVRTAVGAVTDIVPTAAEQPMPSVAPEPLPEPPPEFEPVVPDPIPEPMPVEPLPEPMPEPVAPAPAQPEEPAPTHPSVAVDVDTQPRAIVEDLLEIGITVRNTGDVKLHDVRVQVQLPEQLHHRRGDEVQAMISELDVGGSQRATLRVRADSPGRAVMAFDVAAAEPTQVNAERVILVDPKPAPPPAPKPVPVAKAPAAPKATPKPKPTTVAVTRPQPKPAAPCCCPFDGWDEWTP